VRSLIEVEHLTKFYGAFPAIQDISFRVEKGDIMGFLGPNAAGKTTTMRILTCFMPATSGNARVAGCDIFSDPLETRRHIGYLPESVPLYTDMSVFSYLKFMACVKGVPRKQRNGRIASVIDSCGLSERSSDLIGHLSKGYRQRVGIAQALVHDPDVLILDEPTVGLDPKQINEIRGLIKGLGGNRTIVLSTHILPEVAMICNKVVIIDEGKVIAMDSPENLTQQLMQSRRVRIIVRGPSILIEERLKDIPGIKRVERKNPSEDAPCVFELESNLEIDIRSSAAAQIVKNGWELLELRSISMSLEDIFLKLTTKEKEAIPL